MNKKTAARWKTADPALAAHWEDIRLPRPHDAGPSASSLPGRYSGDTVEPAQLAKRRRSQPQPQPRHQAQRDSAPPMNV
jgi:hypothetical protein